MDYNRYNIVGECSLPESYRPLMDLHVLVVDDDTTTLSLVSAMLRILRYKVMTVKNPLDALATLRTQKGLIDLVVTDFHMPYMNGFQLQEQIDKEFQLPVIMMSADDRETVLLRSAQSGMALFILKPVTPNDLKNLWQYAIKYKKEKSNVNIDEEMDNGTTIDIVMNNQGQVVDTMIPVKDSFDATQVLGRGKEIVLFEPADNNSNNVNVISSAASSTSPTNDDDVAIIETLVQNNHGKGDSSSTTRSSSSINVDGINNTTHGSNKSSASHGYGRDDNYHDKRKAPKKTKVVWTNSLQNRFLLAIKHLTLDKAVPKKILDFMNVPGLTRENVASHLQKYRMFLKKVADKGLLNMTATQAMTDRILKSSFAAGYPQAFALQSHEASTSSSELPQPMMTATYDVVQHHQIRPPTYGYGHIHPLTFRGGLNNNNNNEYIVDSTGTGNNYSNRFVHTTSAGILNGSTTPNRLFRSTAINNDAPYFNYINEAANSINGLSIGMRSSSTKMNNNGTRVYSSNQMMINGGSNSGIQSSQTIHRGTYLNQLINKNTRESSVGMYSSTQMNNDNTCPIDSLAGNKNGGATTGSLSGLHSNNMINYRANVGSSSSLRMLPTNQVINGIGGQQQKLKCFVDNGYGSVKNNGLVQGYNNVNYMNGKTSSNTNSIVGTSQLEDGFLLPSNHHGCERTNTNTTKVKTSQCLVSSINNFNYIHQQNIQTHMQPSSQVVPPSLPVPPEPFVLQQQSGSDELNNVEEGDRNVGNDYRMSDDLEINNDDFNNIFGVVTNKGTSSASLGEQIPVSNVDNVVIRDDFIDELDNISLPNFQAEVANSPPANQVNNQNPIIANQFSAIASSTSLVQENEVPTINKNGESLSQDKGVSQTLDSNLLPSEDYFPESMGEVVDLTDQFLNIPTHVLNEMDWDEVMDKMLNDN
ncbi:hypothetical protein G4B88_013096 [Cannabis sativa]|uniref:Response regulatory domain-containing protein n=1 Tax=Cannabis sativa TaxID=3483 RepID=A0A7J6I451_CANSA|nr:hypothetical protein G4B88_013096 [Cannabis sativa]